MAVYSPSLGFHNGTHNHRCDRPGFPHEVKMLVKSALCVHLGGLGSERI